MPSKKKTYNGKYITYKDQQSLGETHDMLVKALPGQSYVKETLHKVSTTQVTGDALMKVSVGGKGGFAAGTAGDVREKKKELNAELIRMEKKHIWMQRLEVMHTLGIERDYFDFTYQSESDASDYMRGIEWMYATQDIIPPLKLDKPVRYCQRHGNKNHIFEFGSGKKITKEKLEWYRGLYEELCGYRGAWKYLGLNGAEHRRYRISIENTLNFNDAKTKGSYTPKEGYMGWETSSYNHHIVGPNFELYHDSKDGKVRKDCVQYTIMQLDRLKKPFDADKWVVSDPKWLNEVPKEPSKEFLELKEAADQRERQRRLEALKKAPRLDDWRMVYNWELTKQGKTMFANEKI